MVATTAQRQAPWPARTRALATRAHDALRANRWPDRSRLPVLSIFILIAYMRMLAHVFSEATGHVGSDFLAFWGAGRLVLAGTPQDAFNLAAEHAAQAASHTGQMVAYVNPPPYLLLTAPLVVLASPVAYLAACHAQNGFVTGALLVGGVIALARCNRRDDVIAGVLFGALVIKPHLAVLVPLWLIAGARWRVLAAGAASALGLCVLSLLAFGTQTWAAWPRSFDVSAVLMAQNGGPFWLRMATPYALLREWTNPGVALAGQAAITLMLAVVVWRTTRRSGANAGTGALMLAATAVASPYLFSYDLPFLIQPTLWLVTTARARGWRPWEKPAVIGLWLAPLATRAMALPLHANLMPFAGLLLVAMIATRLRPAQAASGQSTISG